MRAFLIASLMFAAAAAPSAVSAQKSPQLASAQTNVAQPAADTRPVTAAAAEKKICKLLPSSFSRRSDRVCMTKGEWAKVEAEAQ